MLAAGLALRQTAETVGFFAAATIGDTGVTKLVFTGGAPVCVALMNGASALVTRRAVPVGQADVWAAWVVVLKDRADQHKEVADSSVGQRRPDRGSGVTLTEVFVIDVGVCHGIVGGGWVRIEGHNPVHEVAARTLHPPDLQDDLELAQLDLLQLDSISRH